MKYFCLAMIMLQLFFPPTHVSAAGIENITAKSAIVIDALTGKVLYEKAGEERRYPASTTKMMTLIVALEHSKLDDLVMASANAANTEGSTLWLTAGETLTMHDLLYGMMLVSGNDATVVLAEHIGGSTQNFAKLMTQKAHTIGAINTNFTNSSGLPDPNHYSTAHDLATIAAYGYKNPVFAEIVSTKNKVIPWKGKDYNRDLYNENKLLWLYEGANGVKTGYTEVAGRCLVSAAQRNGIQLITVVLDSDHMWEDSMALLDYGFSNVRPERLFEKGDILKTVRVVNGWQEQLALKVDSSIIVPMSANDQADFKTIVEVPSTIEAPIKPGQKIGVVKTMYKYREIAVTDLVAAESIERKSLFSLLWGKVCSVFSVFIGYFV